MELQILHSMHPFALSKTSNSIAPHCCFTHCKHCLVLIHFLCKTELLFHMAQGNSVNHIDAAPLLVKVLLPYPSLFALSHREGKLAPLEAHWGLLAPWTGHHIIFYYLSQHLWFSLLWYSVVPCSFSRIYPESTMARKRQEVWISF